MRKYFWLIVILAGNLFSQQHFTRGVNLTNWFQADNVGRVQFTKYTKQDFLNLKSLGCDVIRLPINMRGMTNGSPNYSFDTRFLFFLDMVIDWAEEVEINLIIDNHTFDVNVNTSINADAELIPTWIQLAERYKNRSEYIYYEVLNEPHGITDAAWNLIQQNVVAAIREIDTVHTIIIGGAGWNSYNNLQQIPVYDDDNLIYTFHFYDPFLFTHQGATWSSEKLGFIENIPFPYSVDEMPDFPSEARGDWVESTFNNYVNDGTIERVYELIDIAVNFRESRNVEIFCGEFGVYIPNSPPDDRIFWYDIVRSYLEEKNISWTIWDYHGGFGIFEEGSNGLFNHDLNVELVEALGLTAPPQSEFIIQPDSTGFPVYYDFIEAGINNSNWGTTELDFYSEENPFEGNYCISWSDTTQYNQINFDFLPDKDLSRLHDENSFLSIYIKGNTPGTSFDLRFIDTDTEDPNDHPWRMRYTVDASIISWDGNWHHLNIPLKNFYEHGAYENQQWYSPIGDFDWAAIDRFEIVAEQKVSADRTVWFDKIEIIHPNDVGTEKIFLAEDYQLFQNYPNPFNPVTKIRFRIPVEGKVDLRVYDILGREVALLLSEYLKAGQHEINFNAGHLSSNVYFYKIQSGKFIDAKKFVLMK